MKLLNSDDRIAWIRLSHKRNKREKKRLEKKRNKQSHTRRKGANPSFILKSPEIFELIGSINRKLLLEFIEKLRNKVLIQKRRVRIDFSNAKRMVVCGTLLFFSEFHRIERELGSLNLVSCIPPKDETAAQVLQHLGILKMLKNSCPVIPKRSDVINWKIASGELTDATKVGQILEAESRLPQTKAKKLYRGVSEAMTNVSQHAYMDLRNDGAEIIGDKGWWMFCREEDNHISIAFCDLGVGIPITLPKTMEENNEENLFKLILYKLFPDKKKYSDGELIRAAIEVKRSRTQKRHRGKGLLDMIKAIETTQGGRLVILSNKGGYLYNLNNSKPSEDVKNYKDSIFGTLILWSLPISRNTEVKS